VLKLLTEGFSHKEIGDKLCISPKTVDSHRCNVLKKFNVKTTAELIVLATKSGLADF